MHILAGRDQLMLCDIQRLTDCGDQRDIRVSNPRAPIWRQRYPSDKDGLRAHASSALLLFVSARKSYRRRAYRAAYLLRSGEIPLFIGGKQAFDRRAQRLITPYRRPALLSMNPARFAAGLLSQRLFPPELR